MGIMLFLVPAVHAYELKVSIDIDGNRTQVNDSETIQFKIAVKNTQGTATQDVAYALIYWVEDMTPQEVKPKLTVQRTLRRSRTDSFQWTPAIAGHYNICATVTNVTNESNSSDNIACRAIEAVGPVQEEAADNRTEEDLNETDGRETIDEEQNETTISETVPSSLRIISHSPARPMFGDAVFIEIEGTRGSTNKYVLAADIRSKDGEKLSQDTKFQIKRKETDFSILLPVQIRALCKDETSATVTIQGIESSATKEFVIERNPQLCASKEKPVQEKKVTVDTRPDIEVVFPKYIEQGEPFVVSVIARNRANDSLNMTVHGYGYENGAPVTKGHDGEVWKNGWAANRQETVIESGETTVLTLRSMFENETGNVTYRVVVRTPTERQFEKQLIVTTKKARKETNETKEGSPKKTERSDSLTGRVVYAKSSENPFGKLKEFLFSLFT